jgi:predicted transcriptional regulator
MGISFTERELDVMAVLWELGSATVAEVREHLEDDLAYTTVLTVLRTLEEKGYVTHQEEGKAHRYSPLVERNEAGRSALSRILDKVFGGSTELLLTQLVSDQKLSPQELARLRKVMRDNARGRKP